MTTTLTEALAAEHAAIYGYGVAGAHLTGAVRELARSAEAAHRVRRDALLVQLSAGGATPPAAAPAYALPFPVIDSASAIKLTTGIEERTGDIWRDALSNINGDQRQLALDALTDCALRAMRWRRATGTRPGTVALP